MAGELDRKAGGDDGSGGSRLGLETGAGSFEFLAHPFVERVTGHKDVGACSLG